MPQRQLTGSRIRERRLDRGLRQTDLAQAVGISPSYLNLIEHNRRRIGGKLLHDIARALAIDPATLAEGAGGTLIDGLRLAAAGFATSGAELPRADDFAGRFPGWAGLVAAQAERIAALESRVAGLTDRLAHDPQLATSLHQVISAVTSIRSTSSILVSGEGLDRDWQTRFHRNIYDDSVRLAESSRALVNYLEGPDEDGVAGLSPQDEVARFLTAMDHHIPALEGAEAALFPAEIAANAPGVRSAAAISLLGDWLDRYRADALLLPLAPFGAAARACGHDPARLAQEFGCDLATVLRRLAALPPGPDHPTMGLAICDAAGALLHLKPAAGFALPRAGAACPLWPLYQVLGQPGRALRVDVTLPGDRGAPLRCFAVAQNRAPANFDAVPVMEATMLVQPDPPPIPGRAEPVGITCRICPREACRARREPSILG